MVKQMIKSKDPRGDLESPRPSVLHCSWMVERSSAF